MRFQVDAVVAAVVAMAVNGVLLVFLSRAARIEVVGTEDSASEKALQVVWIQRAPSPPPNVAPPMSTSIIARTKPRGTPTRVAPTPITPAMPIPSAAIEAPAPTAPPRAELFIEKRVDFAPNPLAPKPRDLARRNILPAFEMRDTSILGKVTGLGQANLCHELRQLARGSDRQLTTHRVSREVVLRTMEERGCAF
jgi:hypothetical protein